MVEGKDDQDVTYVNSWTGYHSLKIVKSVDNLIYISDTDMEEGHWYPTIEHTIYNKIYLRNPIDFLDLEVKP
jgi:hypothetical protein